jgi:hypothetical protein
METESTRVTFASSEPESAAYAIEAGGSRFAYRTTGAELVRRAQEALLAWMAARPEAWIRYPWDPRQAVVHPSRRLPGPPGVTPRVLVADGKLGAATVAAMNAHAHEFRPEMALALALAGSERRVTPEVVGYAALLKHGVARAGTALIPEGAVMPAFVGVAAPRPAPSTLEQRPPAEPAAPRRAWPWAVGAVAAVAALGYVGWRRLGRRRGRS